MTETPERPAADDEIDLFELAGTLWTGRWRILICTVAGALIAISYALLAEEQWTSTAQVDAPQLAQFNTYMDQRRAIIRAGDNSSVLNIDTDATLNARTSDADKPLTASELAKALFTSFISETAAARNKYDYLRHTTYFKTLTEGIKSETDKNALLTQLVGNMKVQSPGADQIAPYYTLSFSARTAQQAQELLTNYVKAANQLALQEVDDQFRDRINSRLLDWQATLNDTKVQLESARKQQADELKDALAIAKRAGIRDYLVGREDDGRTIIDISDNNKAYMLGERYLSAELETLTNAPLIFPSDYYQTKYKLEQTKPLLDYKADAQTYSYVLAPTLPVHRDKPKRTLIAVLGVLLGGMIGVLWALLASALKRRPAPAT